MKLVSLKLIGYRQFLEPMVLYFPAGLSGICGPNGVGKSKLIEAIGYALYGATSPVLPRGDKVSDLPSRACTSKQADARVELCVEIHGQLYEIIRSPHIATIQLQGTAELLAVGAKAVTTKVIEMIHLSPAAYYGTFVAQQKEVAGLQTLPHDERKRLINRLIGIEQVEHALKLADTERKTCADRLEFARERQGRSSKVIIEEQNMLRKSLDIAQEKYDSCKMATNKAKEQYEIAYSTVTNIQQHRETLKGLRRTLGNIQQHHTSLDSTYLQANKRLTNATDTAQKLSHIRAMLEQMIKIQDQLEYWNRIETIDLLRTEQATLSSDLTERLNPLLAKRKTLQQAIEAATNILDELHTEKNNYQQERIRIEQYKRHATGRIEKSSLRMENIRQLGPNGVCETCGQTFGNTIETALAHYTAESNKARLEETQAEQQIVKLVEKETALQQQINECTQEHTASSQQLLAYDKVPGELAMVQHRLDEVGATLATYSLDERTLPYDEFIHNAIRAEIDKKQQMQTEVTSLQATAETVPELRKEVEALEKLLLDSDQEQQKIEIEINEEVPLVDTLEDAIKNLTLATTIRDEQIEKELQEFQHLTKIMTQLEVIEQEIEQARVQEKLFAETETALLVAERTKDLMTKLLQEITAEARPRLVELLDTWVRALLGQRFRQVDLTEDYRLMADNGSGLHQITHFSGGEQTLLAVMLRVAIALFSRESSGLNTSFLILDEVFGDQDGEHRALLVQFLGEIKEYYHQILVINHVDDVTEMLDSIIDIKPTGLNTSSAKLRN